MLSTSFIVARQPDNTSRQKGFSRNSVTNFNFGTHEPDNTQDLMSRGRDTVPRQQDNIYELTTPTVDNTKEGGEYEKTRKISVNE